MMHVVYAARSSLTFRSWPPADHVWITHRHEDSTNPLPETCRDPSPRILNTGMSFVLNLPDPSARLPLEPYLGTHA